MNEFGDALRAWRRRRGLTQAQFSASLGGQFARSTIANVETGRETPSARLWAAIGHHHPHAAAELESAYLAVRLHDPSMPIDVADAHDPRRSNSELRLGGDVVIERLDLTYVFRESRSPEEILEVRSVRALRHGADRFVLKLKAQATPQFMVSPELLWGGRLSETQRTDARGETIYISTVLFERPLRRGEHHTFAVRTWVERDPEPDSAVEVTFSVPAEVVCLHANFLGPRPRRAWSYGPLVDDSLAPKTEEDPASSPVHVADDGPQSVTISRPSLGMWYGLAWSWD